MYDSYGWGEYVSVAERRRKAASKIEGLKKNGHAISPVVIEGRTIARTFWGKSWCDNLERYSDYANRLPRGRSYVRNGSVIDLQIAPGEVKALVSGSEIYKVTVLVAPVSKERWQSICADCAGAIDSLVELLQGSFSKGVMERVCQQQSGLFPSPSEIKLSCSCPDWADMCKHVAAVLYGVGARLDQQPELLFRLHKVDEKELIAEAGNELPFSKNSPASTKVLGGGEDLSALFGLEIAQNATSTEEPVDRQPSKPKRPRRAIAADEAAPSTSLPKKKKSSRKQAGKSGKQASTEKKISVSKKAAKKTSKQASKKAAKKAAKKSAKKSAKKLKVL